MFVNQNGSKSYIGLKAGVTYTISYRADSNAYFRGINENGSYITNIIWMNTGVINERHYGRITPSIDIPYGVIYRSGGLSEAQIEVGSEATSYEPYESTTLTIQFPQTIYGGYVDLVKGEVVETQTKAVLDGENIKVNRAGYNSDMYYGSGWVYANPLGLSSENGKNNDLFLCDKLPMIAPAFCTVPSYSVPAAGNLYYQIRVLAKEDYQNELTATEILNLTNEWLKDNPLTMVYPLKNENTYSLTPQTITTLRGANTIWTNSNDETEVKYYTHGDDSYQHVPTSDAITSSDDFLLVTDDGYVIGTEDDFITY